MFEFKIGIHAKEHDTFVESHPLCNLLQSSSWGKVKDNWSHDIVGVYQEGRLVASSLVLIKPLPLGFSMLYTPRGPIMDYNKRELVQFFLNELKKYGKKRHALFLKMDPAIHYKDFHLDQEQVVNQEAQKAIDVITESGAIHQGLTMDMHETIQPRFQANVYQKDFSADQLSKRTKKMMDQARKKGVTIHQGRSELVADFTRVIELTIQRKNISLRSGDYFQKLLDTYPDCSFILLAEVDLKQRYEETQMRFRKNQEELMNIKENQVKKKHNLEELNVSLTREITELEENREQSGDKAIVAGALAITYGKTSEILYAGMDDRYKRYMPAYLTWYEAIDECFRRGCSSCNMGGLEGNLSDGLLKFKANFNPTINEFVGEFDLPINKFLFKISEKAYKLRK